MTFNKGVVTMTQAELDALPREPKRIPEWPFQADFVGPSQYEKVFGYPVGTLFLHRQEGTPAPCRANGCNCYVGDSIGHSYRVVVEG